MKFYGIKDIQEMLGISRPTVYELMNREDNPLVMFRIKQGSKWRVKDVDFDRWLKGCERSDSK